VVFGLGRTWGIGLGCGVCCEEVGVVVVAFAGLFCASELYAPGCWILVCALAIKLNVKRAVVKAPKQMENTREDCPNFFLFFSDESGLVSIKVKAPTQCNGLF